jgi:hypothetical protein
MMNHVARMAPKEFVKPIAARGNRRNGGGY